VVGVKFVHGISAMEMITKNDQSAMTPEEIAALLTIHGVEALWQREAWNRPDWQRWRTQDGALVAVYDMRRHFLYINTNQFYNY
jgi:hypothetical protein